MTATQRVLVIGDDTRSFLSTVRSLGRQGIEVHAAPYGLNSPALNSRYIHQVHLLPYYLDGGERWLARLRDLVGEFKFDLIIPCEERSLLPLYKHQAQFPCAIAVPNEASLDAFFDKVNTRALAAEQGVPVSKGLLLTAELTSQSISETLAFPIIAKYRKSYSWPELYVRTGVTIIRSSTELERWLAGNRDKVGEMFFEQMFPGFGLGVSVLCHAGSILQAFEHHRAHELDGSSYYRKSAPVDPERLQAVTRMVARVSYTGLAMFEFKQDPLTGAWVLLEVNARPWGSLPLPVALGVDFPFRLLLLLTQAKATPALPYRNGIYGRNLISDIWQVRATLARQRQGKAAYLLKWAAGLLRVLVGREHHDVLVRDDLRPGLLEIKEFLHERLRALAPPGRLRANAGLAQATQPQAGRPTHVVFLCQGNICRSPYAEIRARQLFAERKLPVSVASAGMLPRNRRASPPYAQAAAARRGVDLAEHRSQHAFDEVLKRADLIVIFDTINRRSLLNRHPELASRLYFLSQFSDARAMPEIIDPDGRDDRAFDDVYAQIDRGIEGMANSLASAGNLHAR